MKQHYELTHLGLGNYYGVIGLLKKDGMFYITLDDHSSTDALEIDEETYNRLMKYEESKVIANFNFE